MDTQLWAVFLCAPLLCNIYTISPRDFFPLIEFALSRVINVENCKSSEIKLANFFFRLICGECVFDGLNADDI